MTYVDLSEVSQEEQKRVRGYIAHLKQNGSSFRADHPWVGTRIWRPVHKVVLMSREYREPWDDLLIEDAKIHRPGAVQAKVLRAWCREDGAWVARDADSRGLVCFCYEPIPENWTYFEIVSVHFLENLVIVHPVAGDRRELLRMA